MKPWERVVEARLRKYRDGQRELHCVFVDLEKAYDRVPREELWYCMRKSGVAEKYVRVVQDMYERSRTVLSCAIVMNQLSEEVRQESPWTMMFADDIVICSESREQVEENLERWRFALERRGMKVSRSKTEYMCVNEREGSGTVRLQGEEVKKVQEFKYLGSTVQSNGECGKEVKKRVQAGWNGWRKVSGVLCDRKISARIKGKVYRTVVRPAMLYGLETVSLRKRQESELEVAELKMLRFSLGVTRLDRIRNEYIRGTAHVGRLGDKVREARLRWFGHVQRRESEYIGRRHSKPQDSLVHPQESWNLWNSMGMVCFLPGWSLISDTTASARISACLADISSWMTAHQLKLNPSKTEPLIIPAKNGPAPSYLKALITPRTAPRSLRSTSTARLVPPSLSEKAIVKKHKDLASVEDYGRSGQMKDASCSHDVEPSAVV
ncbi:hypothetical protein QTP86_012489 [Hemibagrus guttatus]|nr:hypothetical protein QTP86_012489 [Hemibagrus guttatus]